MFNIPSDEMDLSLVLLTLCREVLSLQVIKQDLDLDLSFCLVSKVII